MSRSVSFSATSSSLRRTAAGCNTSVCCQEFRGRGLGRALLEHALASFAARGRVKAGLGVDTRNETGALALYESVGMRPLFQVDFWQRRIPKA